MRLTGDKAKQFCARPGPDCCAFLLFGEDEGVVTDAANTLIQALQSKQGESEIVSLDETSLRREPALLFDALEARSLLGHQRLLRLRLSDQRLASLLDALLRQIDQADRPFEAPLIISAGSLPKRSKLRAAFESTKRAAALHFFSDEAADIAALAKQAFAQKGVAIEPEALAVLVEGLPGHRGLAHQEIEKLALYANDIDRPLNLEDIQSLSTTDIDHSLRALIDECLCGEVKTAMLGLEKLFVSGSSPISVLRGLQGETLRLLEAHRLAVHTGELAMRLRPPVYKNQWPHFRQKMGLWSPKHLMRLLERIYEAEAEMKSAGALAKPVLKRLIGELTHAAHRQMQLSSSLR